MQYFVCLLLRKNNREQLFSRHIVFDSESWEYRHRSLARTLHRRRLKERRHRRVAVWVYDRQRECTWSLASFFLFQIELEGEQRKKKGLQSFGSLRYNRKTIIDVYVYEVNNVNKIKNFFPPLIPKLFKHRKTLDGIKSINYEPPTVAISHLFYVWTRGIDIFAQ